MQLSRRGMITKSALLTSGFCAASTLWVQQDARPRFLMSLRCGNIGVAVKQRDAMQLAHQFGFQAVTPEANELAKCSESLRSEIVDELNEKGLAWGAASLPADFRNDESSFHASVENLPKIAEAMQQAGVTRVGTYLKPGHDDLTYTKNFQLHVRRLRACAIVLKDHGQRLGLEYVGPKTSWTRGRHSFIHTLKETMELITEINVDNVGLILDSWHWYTAHEGVEDLRSLQNRDIVACDLNDAPRGKEIDDQIDNQRELPMATGVIDLKAFLTTLVQIGYDGPVRAEPFNAELNTMDDAQAVAATAQAMKKAFQLVGG